LNQPFNYVLFHMNLIPFHLLRVKFKTIT
jgi:hypothetical protein